MFRSTFAALAVLALAGTAAAQCFRPDNLSGPCWQPTQAALPSFPSLQLPGAGVCWEKCDPQPLVCTRVVVGAPVQRKCAQFDASIDVFDCTGGQLLTGRMILDYTRTWEEASPTGNYQVWRFVVKAEIGGGTATDPCVSPPELAAGARTFYYGYLDYAFNCNTGGFELAMMLFHNCDEFIHKPGISAQPGVFHPTRSYALVAPHTAANPFVPMNLAPSAGAMVAEAVRNVRPGAGASCVFEERLQSGNIAHLGSGCGCTLSATPAQLTARRFKGTGACPGPIGPSAFFSVNLFPTFPWFDVMTTSIGCWSSDVSYPGKECVWADEGPFLYVDGCAGGVFAEMQYGASTSEGYDVLPDPVGGGATKNFTDLASNLTFPLGSGVPLPIVGFLGDTRHLIYVNVP